MKLKVHYVTDRGLICNEEGSVSCQTHKPAKVTCKRCQKALQKGLQTRLDI